MAKKVNIIIHLIRPALLRVGRIFTLMSIRMRRVILAVVVIAVSATSQGQSPVGLQIRCAIAGSVVDAISGQPVRAAEVSATSLSPTSGSDEPPKATNTDSNGRFAIENLAPGRYVLQAYHDGYTSPDRPSGSGSGIVVLAPGQHVEDVVLSLMPGGTISGRITNEDGTPLRGASLQAMKYSYRDGRRELEEMASAPTNIRGEYRIAGLAPGKYYLRATSAPLPRVSAGKDKTYVPLYYPDSSDLTRANELAIHPGQELTGIDVTLTPFPTVHLKGRAIDTRTSSPAKGVEVTLLSDQGNTLFSPGQVSTDADGQFDFSAIPQGSYVLVARLDSDTQPDTPLWDRKSVEVSDRNVEDLKIQVGPGVNVSGHISVDGKATLNLSDLKATLEPQEGLMLNSLMPTVEDASVGPDGTFTFRHVPEGTYSLNFFPLPPGYYLGEREGTSVLETGMAVGPSHRPPRLELILSPASAWIEGTVSADGPVAGASIVLVPDPRRRNQPRYYKMTISNRLGRFTCRGIVPGDYKLFAWDEMPSGTFMDPEFLREYEDRGQLVHLEESTHASVQLQLITRSTAR